MQSIQSENYVPGVSGFKLTKSYLEFNDMPGGPVRIGRLESEAQAPDEAELNAIGLTRSDIAEPFIVINGVTYIREAEVKCSKVASAKVDGYGIKLQLNANGDYVAVGCGLGIDSQCLVSADKFAIKQPTEFEKALAKGAGAVLELLAGTVSETQLGKDLKAGGVTPMADQIREVIRVELRPGGLLHRS